MLKISSTKRYLLSLACIGVLVLSGCSLQSITSGGEITQGDEILQTGLLCNELKCFKIEIADTEDLRRQGLMFRETLAPDAGMLFVFEKPGIHSFRMKNTLISLDILWIDEEFRIVGIHTALPCETDPCSSYAPEESARYVLEINAGSAHKYGFIAGSKVEIQ